MDDKKVTMIQNLYQRAQTDTVFAEQLEQQDTLDDMEAFLQKSGYDLDKNTIMILGKISVDAFGELNDEELPTEVLEMVAGGNFKDFWKGFRYGFTHPFSSLHDLCSKKGQDRLLKKVESYSGFDFLDSVFHI